jgi:hypothetical protein
MQVGHDESERLLDAVLKFLNALENRRLTRADLLRQAAELMRRGFGFEEVSVLTKSSDNLFRYEIVLGYEKEPERELKLLSYTEDEIRNPDTATGVKISKHIDLTIAEAEQKEGQTIGYAHPQLISVPRKNSDDFTYGDYIDVYVCGKDDKFLAVFELSNPRDGKLPSGGKLKWLGLFATVMGNLLQNLSE